MEKKVNLMKKAAIFGICGSLLVTGTASAERFFNMQEDGVLERPTGYREWVHVGTPLTPNDMNNGAANFKEYHVTYIDPDSWAIWKRTGKFPDGTIIVKEMVAVGSKAATSGNGYFMGEFAGLEASIKSTKYFPNEPGNWAYFSFSTPAKSGLPKDGYKSINTTAKASPAAACNACHAGAAADDFVFTQYYPVLRFGKGKGKEATGGYQDKLIPAPFK